MKSIKYLLLFYFLIIITIQSKANPNDSISTKYAKGEFVTFCQISNSASDSITNEVINLFVKQMCNDIRGLFKWGLKDMGLANEKDELIVFDFKETSYNKQTGIIKGTGDVHVTGVTTFKDLSMDTKLTQRSFKGGRREVRLDLATPNPFVRNLRSSFYFVPKASHRYGYLQVSTNIQFAWFFNVFVTQKTYKTILEWRIRQMLKNIKEESERRSRLMEG